MNEYALLQQAVYPFSIDTNCSIEVRNTLLLEPGLLGLKTINGSNFDVTVAKCLHTKSYKYNQTI